MVRVRPLKAFPSWRGWWEVPFPEVVTLLACARLSDSSACLPCSRGARVSVHGPPCLVGLTCLSRRHAGLCNGRAAVHAPGMIILFSVFTCSLDWVTARSAANSRMVAGGNRPPQYHRASACMCTASPVPEQHAGLQVLCDDVLPHDCGAPALHEHHHAEPDRPGAPRPAPPRLHHRCVRHAGNAPWKQHMSRVARACSERIVGARRLCWGGIRPGRGFREGLWGGLPLEA